VKKIVLRKRTEIVGSGHNADVQQSVRQLYAEVLNEQQLDAVFHEGGPVLVIAGAGTGKTRTLVYRIARLVADGTPPSRILLLTFTRKAAAEMLSRAASLLDARCSDVAGGTFHSFAWSVLRRYAVPLGLGSEAITILDQGDAEDVMQIARTAVLGNVKSAKRFPPKAMLLACVSKSVNMAQAVEDVLRKFFPTFVDQYERIVEVLQAYQAYKNKHRLLDYDDLLLRLLEALRHPTVGVSIRDAFAEILVDEYQDTNQLQHAIVAALAPSGNVMVVGDDAQSIYAFRGADVRNIHRFPEGYPTCTVVRLERNYRSSQAILDCCNAIIHAASNLYPKQLVSNRPDGELPMVVHCTDEAQQSEFITQHILESAEEGTPLNHIAVLFRNGFQSFDLELALARNNIPFRKIGGLRFAEAAHVKDLLALVRVVVNYRDAVAWTRVLLLLEGVGPATAQTVVDHITTTWVQGKGALPNSRLKSRDLVQNLLNVLHVVAETELQIDKLKALATWYRAVLDVKYDDGPRRWKDIETIVAIGSGFPSLSAFLADIALDPPQDALDGLQATPNDEDVVTLSTIHSAKGLEWKKVFVIGVNEGRLPSARAADNPEAIEEERRLLYVACTRAKDFLCITYLGTEVSWEHGAALGVMSRFLIELPSGVSELFYLEQPTQESNCTKSRNLPSV